MGGLRAVAETDLWVAVTGAWGAVRIDGRDADPYEAHAWPAGRSCTWIGSRTARVPTSPCAAGSTAACARLAGDRPARGSRPAALRAGDVVGVRDDARDPIPVAPPAVGRAARRRARARTRPRTARRLVHARPLTALYDTVWTVSNHADRVGARLDGPGSNAPAGRARERGHGPRRASGAPERPAHDPARGRSGDRRLPRIAVVTDAALDLVAQARPGTRIRFRHARPPA